MLTAHPDSLPVAVVEDQDTDLNGQRRHRLAQIVPFPSFVKAAARDALADEELDPTHYADLKRRRFPMHTAAATWLSAAYFLDQKSAYTQKEASWIRTRLENRATFFGIEGALRQLQEKLAAHQALPEEEQLPDECFAIVWPQPDGSKIRKYPLRNPGEVKSAAEYYVRYRDDMPFPVRKLFAQGVLDKSAEMGLRLPQEELLTRAAGQGSCAIKEAAQLLLDRVLASKKAGPGKLGPIQQEMLKLAKTCLEKPSQLRSYGGMEKLAEVVDQFDRSFGLHRHYDGGFPRPEDVLFGVTKEALASLARDNVETTTGQLYKLADLERLRVKEIRDHLGDEYAEALTSDGIHLDLDKAASVLGTLPRPDAALFDQLCVERGILAWSATKEAETMRLSRDYLHRLAQTRR